MEVDEEDDVKQREEERGEGTEGLRVVAACEDKPTAGVGEERAKRKTGKKRTPEEGHPMVGKRVTLVGSPRPEMNGMLGTCTAYVAEAERYIVKLDKKGKKGAPIRVKAEWIREATEEDEKAASPMRGVLEQLGA